MNAKWLSETLDNSLYQNPNLKINEIHSKALRKWNTNVTISKARRAKIIASYKVEDSFKNQFKKIYDYAHELLRYNPGSTVKVKVDSDNGKYKGELFTSIGRDPNDQMLPLAYAIVEVENKDSWAWFLELLIEDLGGAEVCNSCTFMADQQKGLLPAMSELLPRAEYKFCMRHLYANFRKKTSGQNMKNLMWKAAASTYPQAWEREMLNIKEVNEEAYKYLIVIPSSWSAEKPYEVRHFAHITNKFVVNLDSQDCTCRKWLISGIPCCHAIAAMKLLNLDPEDYVPISFRRQWPSVMGRPSILPKRPPTIQEKITKEKKKVGAMRAKEE
ncbi:uncharacterized protein LOC124845628 [Vigna umbellata]|uniref:uncharacterized protein LOC124845628 n=1 Tax=Vigna umbellata TaxID=87088 RepID=UPI001F5ED11D|nr:uncharacterized protein LOC124845628 [Vigna umbellata]